ncbi:unnamed protein product [Camellia sinensis]
MEELSLRSRRLAPPPPTRSGCIGIQEAVIEKIQQHLKEKTIIFSKSLRCNIENDKRLWHCRTKAPAAYAWGLNQLKAKGAKMELSIMQPDDWHLHLRDGVFLEVVISHRGIVMPNLKPPIKTTAAAVAYRESILKALPANSDFIPLMTLYLTDTTTREEIKLARGSGVVYAVKLYPAGATTNSQDGVTDLFGKCLPVFEEMVKHNMPLLVHGEVTDPEVDIFNRERVFIDTVLRPLIQRFHS